MKPLNRIRSQLSLLLLSSKIDPWQDLPFDVTDDMVELLVEWYLLPALPNEFPIYTELTLSFVTLIESATTCGGTERL